MYYGTLYLFSIVEMQGNTTSKLLPAKDYNGFAKYNFKPVAKTAEG